MRDGAKSYRIEGLFPPEPPDPVFRLIFPRAVKPTDTPVDFRLYLPGLPFPEREAQFLGEGPVLSREVGDVKVKHRMPT